MKISIPKDGGSLARFEAEEGLVRLWLQQETPGRASQWFHFIVQTDADIDRLSFSIENASDSFYPRGWVEYRPLISPKVGVWQRVDESYYDSGRLVFTVLRPPREFAVAYYEPYGVSQYLTWLDAVPSEVAVVRRDPSGISMVDIGAGDYPQGVVIARQHPGESMASFVVEGLVGFLVSQDPMVTRWRETGLVRVVPMMNPGGVERGLHRVGACQTDYNRAWDQASPPAPVAAVREMLHGLPKVGILIDVHGDEVTRSGTAYFIDSPRTKLGASERSRADRFVRAAEKSRVGYAIVRKRPAWWRRLRNALRPPHSRVTLFTAGMTASDYCASVLQIPSFTLEVRAHGTSANDCREIGVGVGELFIALGQSSR